MPHFEIAILLIFMAAVIRGYTGFGFAAIAISGLSFIWPAKVSVPVILLLDLICSIGLLRKAWCFADMDLLKQLSMGAFVGIPCGLLILTHLPDSILKLSVSVSVLAMSCWLLKPHYQHLTPHKWLTREIGMISGGFTAAASIGGLPVVCYLLLTSYAAQVQRATLVLFLSATDFASVILMMMNQFIDASLLAPTLILLGPAFIGVMLGQWLFHRHTPKSFRHIALPVLISLSLLSLYFNFHIAR
ncbi:sulfite exporter TauE/SafE family protein [Marinomonas sp. THO17]|uniref:sulfite exporter TauE/SafE family protein n=1 Tax=Marinomonas sp. THO17 TaxID=3149048 RepID=UPI00336C16BC